MVWAEVHETVIGKLNGRLAATNAHADERGEPKIRTQLYTSPTPPSIAPHTVRPRLCLILDFKNAFVACSQSIISLPLQHCQETMYAQIL